MNLSRTAVITQTSPGFQNIRERSSSKDREGGKFFYPSIKIVYFEGEGEKKGKRERKRRRKRERKEEGRRRYECYA